MSVPMFKCTICGKDVPRRQSLVIQPQGRVCRSHSEVAEHQAKLEEEAKKEQLAKELERLATCCRKISQASKQEPIKIRPSLSFLVTPKDFQNGWRYKYVRMATGKVLFCEAGNIHISHKTIVDSGYTHPVKPGDPLSGEKPPPVSAGTIKVKHGKWCIVESGSVSTGLTRGESDEEFIAKELGPKFSHDVEAGY